MLRPFENPGPNLIVTRWIESIHSSMHRRGLGSPGGPSWLAWRATVHGFGTLVILVGPDWSAPPSSRGAARSASSIQSAPGHDLRFLPSFVQLQSRFSLNGFKLMHIHLGLTFRSTRTPPAFAGVLFLVPAFSAPLSASAQAGPVSLFR